MEQNYEQNNSIQPFGVIPEQEISIQPISPQNGLDVMLSIGGTLIGVLSGPAGATTSILATIFKTLFPDPNLDVKNVTWTEMINYVSEQINHAITDHILETADDELNVIKGCIKRYQKDLDVYKENLKKYSGDCSNPTVQASADQLKLTISESYGSINNSITRAFKTVDYKYVLLPSYACAATLQLLFLRDVLIQRNELPCIKSNIDLYIEKMTDAIDTHMDYCTKTYNSGLDLEKQKGWAKFNKYRGMMTISVLDVISLFQNYDIRNYNPIYTDGKLTDFDVNLYSMPIKTELTREVYSDVVNDDWGGILSDHDTNEKRFIPAPHLFNWIEEIKLATRNSTVQHFLEKYTYSFLCGHQLRYSRAPRIKTSNIWGPVFGNLTEANMPEKSFNFDGNNCSSVNIVTTSVTHNAGDLTYLKKMTCSVENKGDLIFNTGDPWGGRIRQFSVDDNILSYMGSYRADTYKFGYIFGFTHTSVDPQNTIATDKITQIPAVKAFDISAYYKSGEVIKGPGFTGGDLVKLPNNSQLKIRLTPVNTSKDFIIRIRYARTAGGSVEVQKLNDSLVQYGTYSTPATYSNEKFNYIDTLTTSLNQDKVEIVVRNVNSTSDLIVDKVEFIPVPYEKTPISLDSSATNILGNSPVNVTPFAMSYMNAFNYRGLINVFEFDNAASRLQIRYKKSTSSTFSNYDVEITYGSADTVNMSASTAGVSPSYKSFPKTFDDLSEIIDPNKRSTVIAFRMPVNDLDEHIMYLDKTMQDGKKIYITNIKFIPVI